MMIKKHYTVEWIIDSYYQHYSDFKRFESDEEEKNGAIHFRLSLQRRHFKNLEKYF